MKSNLIILKEWLQSLDDTALIVILNVRRNELKSYLNGSGQLDGNYEYSGEQWTKMIIHYGEKEIRKRKLNKLNEI